MDDSFIVLIFFPVWPLPKTATGVLCNCLVGFFNIKTSEGSPSRAKGLTLSSAVTDRQKQRRYPGCLAHVVRGMYCSAVANRRQPNLPGREEGGQVHSTSPLLNLPFRPHPRTLIRDASGDAMWRVCFRGRDVLEDRLRRQTDWTAFAHRCKGRIICLFLLSRGCLPMVITAPGVHSR